MNYKKTGFGKIVFMEWLFPVFDYFQSLRRNEVVFEILVPLFTAIIASIVYAAIENITFALNALADIIPTAISILIGFTVMFITLLLTSNTVAIHQMKNKKTKAKIRGQSISLYQKLHVQLTESLFAEVTLLLSVFCYLFFKGIGMALAIQFVFLTVEVYLVLHILLSIVRSTTHLYCVFYGASVK